MLARLCGLRTGRTVRCMSTSAFSTVDTQEVEKFRNIDWEGKEGKALLNMHQVRMQAVQDYLKRVHGWQDLHGRRFLDVGCGGGLVTRSLAEMGASVLAVDAVQENVEFVQGFGIAQVETRHGTVEELVKEFGEKSFDGVISLEVVEHVQNVPLFVESCAKMAKDTLIMSSINRTMKSYMLAIVAAEYVTNMVPVGTHDWFKFVQPGEIEAIVHKHSHLHTDEITGLVYNPLCDSWHASVIETDVNYMYFASGL